MQSTTSQKPTEFWWPSPEAFEDLKVEDTETGFTLEAPDNSECGDWLAYWNQTEEHHELFEKEFIKCLKNYIDTTLKEHGKTEGITDLDQENREQTEDDVTGSVSEHEPGCDAFSCPA
jgi:hypothetical protein